MRKTRHLILPKIIQLCLVVFLVVFLEVPSAFADVWAISFKNDIVMGSDEHYTNGLSFEWMSSSVSNNESGKFGSGYRNLVYAMITAVPLVDIKSDQISFGFKIAQDVYTPSDTSEEDLIEDDIPYAGHLYTKYSVFEWNENSAEETYFSLGIVGPASGGEWSQKTFHRLIGNDEPKGWKHQLPNYLTLGFGYTDSMKNWQKRFENGTRLDWINTYGIELGNFFTSATVGTLLRYGKAFPYKLVSTECVANACANRSLSLNSKDHAIGWSINAGAYISALGYSHILDSSDKHDIERKTIISGKIFSLSLYIRQFEIVFSLQAVDMIINDASQSMGWGGITFSTIM